MALSSRGYSENATVENIQEWYKRWSGLTWRLDQVGPMVGPTEGAPARFLFDLTDDTLAAFGELGQILAASNGR